LAASEQEMSRLRLMNVYQVKISKRGVGSLDASSMALEKYSR